MKFWYLWCFRRFIDLRLNGAFELDLRKMQERFPSHQSKFLFAFLQ